MGCMRGGFCRWWLGEGESSRTSIALPPASAASTRSANSRWAARRSADSAESAVCHQWLASTASDRIVVVEGTLSSLESLYKFRAMAAAACPGARRSEEHTSELQSLMRSSSAVFCLREKNKTKLGPAVL